MDATPFPKSAVRHFYVAVGSPAAKLPTLIDLLAALQAGCEGLTGVAVACSARDSADAVAAALSRIGAPLSLLHSDLSPAQADHVAAKLRACLQGAQAPDSAGPSRRGPGDDPSPSGSASGSYSGQQFLAVVGGMAVEGSWEDVAGALAAAAPSTSSAAGRPPAGAPPAILVSTDAGLKCVSREQLPLGLPVLLQYDLPAAKDAQQRRIAAVFGGSRERRGQKAVVVSFVVAGEVPRFRAFEALCGAPVQEMPVHVPDVWL